MLRKQQKGNPKNTKNTSTSVVPEKKKVFFSMLVFFLLVTWFLSVLSSRMINICLQKKKDLLLSYHLFHTFHNLETFHSTKSFLHLIPEIATPVDWRNSERFDFHAVTRRGILNENSWLKIRET